MTTFISTTPSPAGKQACLYTDFDPWVVTAVGLLALNSFYTALDHGGIPGPTIKTINKNWSISRYFSKVVKIQ